MHESGIILVAADGSVVHANAAGLKALTDGPLRLYRGRISAADPELEPLLGALLQASGADSDTALRGAGVAQPARDAAGNRWVIHALPMACRRNAALSGAGAAAILFVQRAETAGPPIPEIIAKAFALTPGELRVLLSVVELGGVPQVAETLGLAETTVKSHLRGLFGKTGARRQADLVKLVSAYASPLA